MTVVEASALKKVYISGVFKKSQVTALSSVSLRVQSGEIFGLLGPNGAGKTTLIKILLSIALPTDGVATLLGLPLGSVKIRERVGYLPENHRSPPFLSAQDTLLFFGRLLGMGGAQLQARATALLNQVGLKDWHRTKIKKFSKGMLQRLGLAHALLNDPEILFLDEPTDGVDPVGRKEIRDFLRDLRSQGKTIFLNSHMLSEVEEICDRVVILDKGEVLHTGTVKDITSHQLEYEVELEQPLDNTVVSQLREISRTLSLNSNKLVVGIREKRDINHVIDLLRNSGAIIESMNQRKSRLEDYFIKLLKKEEPS